MAASSRVPNSALRLLTYAELDRFVQAFVSGHLNLLILVGSAGLAKSQSLKQALGTDGCWIEGNATAFGLFLKLWECRDRLVVIDDVDSLYADRSAVRLLKCLCQTDAVKTIQWNSAAGQLDRTGTPREFKTTSSVCIIANDWATLNANVEAVQDRGHLVLFDPSVAEVHRQVATWFWDQDVFDWFGAHLHLLKRPSMRHYVRAWELKQAGLDWVRLLPLEKVASATLLVASLKADSRFRSENERIDAFVAQGGGCRATYFNHAKKLVGKIRAPELKVQGAPPGGSILRRAG